MASADFERLEEMWDPEILGTFEGKWIAFRGEVIDSSDSLGALFERFAEGDEEGPIFAFVTFSVSA